MKYLLENYAEVLLCYGIKLKKGEKLQILFDEHGVELSKILVRKAYQYGAKDVQTIYRNTEMESARYKYGSDEALSYFPKFEADYRLNSMLDNYHSIHLVSYKGMEADIETEKITAYQKVRSSMLREVKWLGMSNHVKWMLAPVASGSWASIVYPALNKLEAVQLLWQDLFKVCRVHHENPIKEWEQHNQLLKRQTTWLNELDLAYLHLYDLHTDLTVGLVDGHIWCGGINVTKDGQEFLSNIPTEEVYTMPHKDKVNGRICISRPFILFGTVFRDLQLTFRDGQVIHFETSGDQEIMKQFLRTDAGACRLGEIALVDKSSPINQIPYPFYQTLLDENACSHIALGNAYDENILGKAAVKKDNGFNRSAVHEDIMIGSNEMNVTGIKKDGTQIDLMAAGAWIDSDKMK